MSFLFKLSNCTLKYSIYLIPNVFTAHLSMADSVCISMVPLCIIKWYCITIAIPCNTIYPLPYWLNSWPWSWCPDRLRTSHWWWRGGTTRKQLPSHPTSPPRRPWRGGRWGAVSQGSRASRRLYCCWPPTGPCSWQTPRGGRWTPWQPCGAVGANHWLIFI